MPAMRILSGLTIEQAHHLRWAIYLATLWSAIEPTSPSSDYLAESVDHELIDVEDAPSSGCQVIGYVSEEQGSRQVCMAKLNSVS